LLSIWTVISNKELIMIVPVETTEITAKPDWIEPTMLVVEARDAEEGVGGAGDGEGTVS
jgi:hypothetical protein